MHSDELDLHYWQLMIELRMAHGERVVGETLKTSIPGDACNLRHIHKRRQYG